MIEIVFPGDTIETLLGPVNTIVGAGAPRSQWVNHDTRCAAVLIRRASMEHGQRNEIVGATDQALTLRMDGREAATPWSTVTGVSAGRARLDRLSEQWVLVLAIEAEVEGRERLFIVGEVEPAWLPLTATLHQALPDIAPFEVWGAQLVTASEPMELYQRSISPS